MLGKSKKNGNNKEAPCNEEMAKNEDMGQDETPEILDPEEPLDEMTVLKNKNAELIDKLQRNMAEFDNFRKRTIKEKSEMYDIGVVSAVEKILPVIDNFERALNAATNKDDGMYKGVMMIYKQLDGAIRDLGAEPIECMGLSFDPKYHNAVAHEQDDKYEENTVIEELQKGYTYKDKVIRPSMVKVAN